MDNIFRRKDLVILILNLFNMLSTGLIAYFSFKINKIIFYIEIGSILFLIILYSSFKAKDKDCCCCPSPGRVISLEEKFVAHLFYAVVIAERNGLSLRIVQVLMQVIMNA